LPVVLLKSAPNSANTLDTRELTAGASLGPQPLDEVILVTLHSLTLYFPPTSTSFQNVVPEAQGILSELLELKPAAATRKLPLGAAKRNDTIIIISAL
jgi:hypothetical protein